MIKVLTPIITSSILNHGGEQAEPVDSFIDFIISWNFLNIKNINGIISITFVLSIVSIYLVGVYRLSKKGKLSKSRIFAISTALFLLFFVDIVSDLAAGICRDVADKLHSNPYKNKFKKAKTNRAGKKLKHCIRGLLINVQYKYTTKT